MSTEGNQEEVKKKEVSFPKHQSKEVVEALKVSKISHDRDLKPEERQNNGSAVIHFTKKGFDPIRVNDSFLKKNRPEEGGYILFSKGKRTSFMSKEAFEEKFEKTAQK